MNIQDSRLMVKYFKTKPFCFNIRPFAWLLSLEGAILSLFGMMF